MTSSRTTELSARKLHAAAKAFALFSKCCMLVLESTSDGLGNHFNAVSRMMRARDSRRC
jgi:hypothetical protein